MKISWHPETLPYYWAKQHDSWLVRRKNFLKSRLSNALLRVQHERYWLLRFYIEFHYYPCLNSFVHYSRAVLLGSGVPQIDYHNIELVWLKELMLIITFLHSCQLWNQFILIDRPFVYGSGHCKEKIKRWSLVYRVKLKSILLILYCTII